MKSVFALTILLLAGVSFANEILPPSPAPVCQRGFHAVRLEDGSYRCVPNYR